MRLRFFVFFLARLSLLGLIRPCSSGRCHGTASCRSPRRLGADPRTNPWAFGPAVEIKGASMQGWMSHRNKLLSNSLRSFEKWKHAATAAGLPTSKSSPSEGFLQKHAPDLISADMPVARVVYRRVCGRPLCAAFSVGGVYCAIIASLLVRCRCRS